MKTWTLTDVADHWDSTPGYDDINAKIDSYMRRFTDSVSLFTIKDRAKVLDIDCRTAIGTSFFADKYPTANFTLVAMAPSFKKRSEKTLQENRISADVHLFTQIPLPFKDNSFDVILTYETLEHVPWPSAFIAELARIAAPEAIMVLTTPNVLWEPVHWLSATLHLDHGEGPHRMVPRREIASAFKNAGWSITTERSFVIIPAGPKFLLKFGRFFERILPEYIKRIICLRRTFICRKRTI